MPPEKGGEGEWRGKEGKRTFKRSHSSKFATTPLVFTVKSEE